MLEAQTPANSPMPTPAKARVRRLRVILILLILLVSFIAHAGDAGYAGGPGVGPDARVSTILFYLIHRCGKPCDVSTELWTISSDGSGLKQVNKGGPRGVYLDLVWSPDGTKIAFTSNGGPSDPSLPYDLWVMNADGSGARRLVSKPDTAWGNPRWSPDGRKLAVTSASFMRNERRVPMKRITVDIWVMNADGSDAVPIATLRSPTAYVGELAWSPDGGKLAFVSNRALDGSDEAADLHNANLWVMDADGSHLTPLTRYFGTILVDGVAWSPNSNKLLFTSNRDPDEDEDHAKSRLTIRNIWMVNADGTGIRPLSRFRQVNSYTPTWSPDGSRIAFTSMRPVDGSQKETPTSDNIWVMKADGSDALPLTTSTRIIGNGFPAWSPDGTMIAFISALYPNGNPSNPSINNIWVVHPDGSGSRAVTRFTEPDVLGPPLRWRP